MECLGFSIRSTGAHKLTTKLSLEFSEFLAHTNERNPINYIGKIRVCRKGGISQFSHAPFDSDALAAALVTKMNVDIADSHNSTTKPQNCK